MAVRDSGSLLIGLLLLFHTWRAWAAVEVSMEDRVEVFRGDTARITCMYKSEDDVGGITIMWLYATRSGERQNIYFQDSNMKIVSQGTPFTNRINMSSSDASREVVLTIKDVQLADELDFICFVKSLTAGEGEGRTKLKVFETPKHPTIEVVPSGVSVTEDSPSKIGVCEVKNGFPKPNITWYRDKTPLRTIPDEVTVTSSRTIESSGLFSVRSELSMKVQKSDKDALFYCEITFYIPGGMRMIETSHVNITVFYPPTAVSVWVESPKGKIKEGDSVELHCHDNGNIASELAIVHGNDDYSLENNVLVLDNVTRGASGVYQCTSLDMDTLINVSGNVTLSVNFLDPAVVTPKESMMLAQGQELKATCNALSSLQTHTAWFKDGQEILKGHTLILKDATFDTAGTYVCVVTVPEIEDMETRGSLHVNVKGPPEIMKLDNTEIEVNFEKSVELSCVAKGFPAPDITWTTSDGKPVKATSHENTEKGTRSVVSVKVTSDLTVFCNASNDYGADAMTYRIKATTQTTTQATTTTSTTISTPTVNTETVDPPEKNKTGTGGTGVIIAVIITCVLLLAILGSVLYFLYKKGKICGRSGKKDLTKEKSKKDNTVVEMKSDNTEEAILLGVNGEKQLSSDQ
ncbi:melanoma cell adhesion molecule b isoform X1 [Echeneis naucrates]|uniref:Ig-like domain-containing protein n=1 Tax=Echeneis naucrates TaxID=173247 RepID=A0A665VDH5_ECHNA|nr:cell surface glycoprotein MUC18 isoform X1 [Echeneis naucrates]